jgi:hypothetical protein
MKEIPVTQQKDGHLGQQKRESNVIGIKWFNVTLFSLKFNI